VPHLRRATLVRVRGVERALPVVLDGILVLGPLHEGLDHAVINQVDLSRRGVRETLSNSRPAAAGHQQQTSAADLAAGRIRQQAISERARSE
jgi:hypothetical protein